VIEICSFEVKYVLSRSNRSSWMMVGRCWGCDGVSDVRCDGVMLCVSVSVVDMLSVMSVLGVL